MSTDDTHAGLPTRAIHEAYLDMQTALKAYREAKDHGSQDQITQAHGELQQAVLTCYDLLRPHLKNESALEDYWQGKLPEYNHDADDPPDPEDGKGIIHVQTTRDIQPLQDQYQVNGSKAQPGDLQTLADWHEALDLNGSVRIVGLAGHGDNIILTLQNYQTGLRHLDEWETKYTQTIERKDGFMEHETEQRVERQRIPIDRLKRAARELAEAADALGALSDFDVRDKTTKITREDLEEVEAWRQQQIQD